MMHARRRKSRGNFIAISIAQYIPLHLKSNPKDRLASCTSRHSIARVKRTLALRESLRAAENGECCDCGEPIWVLGSAIAGRGCFTCITGEASPSDDYEVTHIRKPTAYHVDQVP